MRYLVHFFIVFLLLIFFVTPSIGIAADDWQYWHKYQLKTLDSKHFVARVEGEQRLRDHFSESYLANIQAGFLLKAGSHFDIGPFYKFQYSKNLLGRYSDESRWSLESNLKTKWSDWGFKDRNLFEYRDLSNRDRCRYRNQITISRDLKVKSFKFSPYISEEIFYDFKDAFNQNRVSSGITIPINQHFSFTLYYLLRNTRSGSDWTEDHILGTTLGIAI